MKKSDTHEEVADQWAKAMDLPEDQKKAWFEKLVIDCFNVYVIKLPDNEGVPAQKLIIDFLDEAGQITAHHLKWYLKTRE